MPYETPIFVDWYNCDKIADIGIELPDDPIEARYIREGGTRTSLVPSSLATAALGLSYVLRRDDVTEWMHDALSEEFARARAEKIREIEAHKRRDSENKDPAWQNWLAAVGINDAWYQRKLESWERDRGQQHHWSHFRHASSALEPTNEELVTEATSANVQYEQPLVVPVRSKLAYTIDRLLGIEERVPDSTD